VKAILTECAITGPRRGLVFGVTGTVTDELPRPPPRESTRPETSSRERGGGSAGSPNLERVYESKGTTGV